MGCTTGAGAGEAQLVPVRSEIGQQLGEAVRRNVRPRDQHVGLIGDETNIFEVGQRIVVQLRIEQGTDCHPELMEQQRVAIWRRFRHARGADIAARAADILDDDGMRLAHGLREQSPDRVSGTSSGERHDEPYRSRGKGLRFGNGRDQQQADHRQ
jgi:hypothetical protein